MGNKQVQIFKNEELGLNARTLVDKDGNISVNVADVAIGLNIVKVDKKMGKNMYDHICRI